jgi:hypothetical protein
VVVLAENVSDRCDVAALLGRPVQLD